MQADDDGVVPRPGKALALGDQAYQALKERLVSGAYGPGQKMTVRAIAEELGFGTTPARDALNRLVVERALVFVGPKTLVVPMLTQEELLEATEIRLALEGLAAERSVRALTVEDRERLEALQMTIEAALDDGRYSDALTANKAFHFLVYERASMPLLLATIEQLWLRVGAAFHDLYPEFAVSRQGVHNHRALLEGLDHNSPGEVRAAIEADIRDGYRRLRKALSQRDS